MEITGLNSVGFISDCSSKSSRKLSSGIMLFCAFLLVSLNTFSQRVTISGYVQDVNTKEVLIGANIYEARLQKGTATNQYGFYSLTLPASDTLNVIFSFS